MKNRLQSAVCGVVAVALVLAASAASAQYRTRGVVTGQVTDDKGASLPGVTLLLESDALTNSYTVLSDAEGKYFLGDIAPGTYVLTTDLQGFAATPLDVTVRVGSTLRVNVQMAGAGFTAAVEVKAEAPQIESMTAQVNKYVSHEEMQHLPLQNREFLDVLTIVPGITAGPNVTRGGFDGPRGGVSIHGARTNQNDFLIDGASNNDRSDTNYLEGTLYSLSTQQNRDAGPPPAGVAGPAGATFQVGTALQTYNLDAIQEVQVATSLFSAEYGSGGSGGVINVITRSGTDQFSGIVTAQQQRDAWVEDNADQDITRNIAAVSLGGAFVEGKSHFFGSFEHDVEELGVDRALFTEANMADNTYPEWLLDYGRPVNDTTRDHLTFKLDQRINAANTLTATLNYLDERATVLDGAFRSTPEDAVVEDYENSSLGGVLRYLTVFSDGNMTVEALGNYTTVDRNFSHRSDVDPFSLGGTPSGTVHRSGPSAPASLTTLTSSGMAIKLGWITDKLHNRFGIGFDGFEQEVAQEEWFQRSTFVRLEIHSYLHLPGQAYAVSVQDLWAFAATDWLVSSKLTLNLGLRVQRDDMVSDLNFEPRLGLAWDPAGDGTQVLRAGVGVYHDRTNLIGAAGEARLNRTRGIILSDDTLVETGPARVVRVDPDLHLPDIYKFVLGYQRRLGPRTSAGITFFANISNDLFFTRWENKPGPDRPDPSIGLVDYYTNIGWTDVYDLELEFRHRLTNGSMLQASYTYQDATGNSISDFINGGSYTGGLTPLDQYTFEGPLSTENEHQFKLSGVFTLPWGFGLSSIIRYNSGGHYSTYELWFEDFSIPHIDPLSDYNSNDIGSYFSIDLRFDKAFRIKQRYELLLYLDIFNLTDQENVVSRGEEAAFNVYGPIGEPGTTYKDDFMLPTGFAPRRSAQIGFKFMW